jgi:hypothetical protein
LGLVLSQLYPAALDRDWAYDRLEASLWLCKYMVRVNRLSLAD